MTPSQIIKKLKKILNDNYNEKCGLYYDPIFPLGDAIKEFIEELEKDDS